MDSFYIGSDLKFLIEITAEGFDQATNNYTIVVKCGGKEKTCTQSDVITSEDGGYYLVLDTEDFMPGVMTATITALVDDDDVGGSALRRQVEVVELCYLKEVP